VCCRGSVLVYALNQQYVAQTLLLSLLPLQLLLVALQVHSTVMQAADFFHDIELVKNMFDLLAHRLFKASAAGSDSESDSESGSQQPSNQWIQAAEVHTSVPCLSITAPLDLYYCL
jgi:hypothetical protein